jgi:hypothetical protein
LSPPASRFKQRGFADTCSALDNEDPAPAFEQCLNFCQLVLALDQLLHWESLIETLRSGVLWT